MLVALVSQLVLETLFCCFFGTLKCVGKQFASGAPLVCGYMTSFDICIFISTLFLLGPMSMHTGVSIEVLQVVQIDVFCMKTKILKNVLDPNHNVQVCRFPLSHKI